MSLLSRRSWSCCAGSSALKCSSKSISIAGASTFATSRRGSAAGVIQLTRCSAGRSNSTSFYPFLWNRSTCALASYHSLSHDCSSPRSAAEYPSRAFLMFSNCLRAFAPTNSCAAAGGAEISTWDLRTTPSLEGKRQFTRRDCLRELWAF